MQNQRHENRKTSEKSDMIIEKHFVNNVDIEPCVRGIRLHPGGVFSDVLMKKKRHVPYVEDTNSDILFNRKGIEMNFCSDVCGLRCIFRRDLSRVLQETLKL